MKSQTYAGVVRFVGNPRLKKNPPPATLTRAQSTNSIRLQMTRVSKPSQGPARELVKKRDAWLNPPGAAAAELKKHTLTDLWSENPTWCTMRTANSEKVYSWVMACLKTCLMPKS